MLVLEGLGPWETQGRSGGNGPTEQPFEIPFLSCFRKELRQFKEYIIKWNKITGTRGRVKKIRTKMGRNICTSYESLCICYKRTLDFFLPLGGVETDVLQFTKTIDENKLGRGVAFPGS